MVPKVHQQLMMCKLDQGTVEGNVGGDQAGQIARLRGGEHRLDMRVERMDIDTAFNDAPDGKGFELLADAVDFLNILRRQRLHPLALVGQVLDQPVCFQDLDCFAHRARDTFNWSASTASTIGAPGLSFPSTIWARKASATTRRSGTLSMRVRLA